MSARYALSFVRRSTCYETHVADYTDAWQALEERDRRRQVLAMALPDDQTYVRVTDSDHGSTVEWDDVLDARGNGPEDDYEIGAPPVQ